MYPDTRLAEFNGESRQRPGGVEAKAWWGRGKGLVGSRQRPGGGRGKGLAGSRQRPGGVEAKAGLTAISCRQSLYEISGCVCSMPCTWRPVRTCILPSSHLDCKVKGAAPFSSLPSPKKSRATLQMLKGLLWHQAWFGVVPSHKGNAVVL